MPLLDPDAFTDKQVACVYVAGRRSEAKRVEAALSGIGIDYVVDIEPFEALILGLFRTQRDGVGFYVEEKEAERGRKALRDAGLLQGLVDDDTQ